nr:hypothetical protein BaRGS_008450 [Batillaria attramentaria]
MRVIYVSVRVGFSLRRFELIHETGLAARDARGLESLAIIFFAIPLVVLPVYIYGALGLYYRCLLGSMTLFVLLGTISNIAGVVVFGVQIGSVDGWTFDWCLIVCIIGGALGLIAFIILLIATINKPEFKPDKYFSSGFYVDPDRNRLYAVESDEPVKVVYPPPSEPTTPKQLQLQVPPQGEVVHVGQVNPAMVPDD